MTTTPPTPAAPEPEQRPEQPARGRVDRRPVRTAALAALVVAAALLTALGAPTELRAPASLLALTLTAVHLARHRRGSALDRALVAVGGLLVLLVLTGLALGVSTGLGPDTWAIALAVVALAALTVSAVRPPAPREDPPSTGEPTTAERAGRRSALLIAPWIAAAAAVTVVAVGLSWRSAQESEQAPLQMSMTSLDGARAVVAVSATERTGPLELRTDRPDGPAAERTPFTVPAGGTVSTTLVIPTTGKVTVTLRNPGQNRPLRTLVVNR